MDLNPKIPTASLREACDLLERAAQHDALCVITLLGLRVPCNEAMAQDPTIQVSDRFREQPTIGTMLGLLGLVNGLSDDPEVAISGEHDTGNRITFSIINNQTGEVLYRPNDKGSKDVPEPA